VPGNNCAEPGTGADRQQRPLRSRRWRRLSAGVDMLSEVKGWEQLFYVCIIVFSF
jgi:hypothetical protein